MRVEYERFERSNAQTLFKAQINPQQSATVFTISGQDGAGEVVLHYKPVEFGRVQVAMGLERYPMQAFSQFIYPCRARYGRATMESVVRGLIVYFFLLMIFRVAGRRTLSEMTTFDLVLLLIISENQYRFVTVETEFPSLEKWLDGRPFVIVEDGKCLKDRMNKAPVDESDVLEAAREMHGLENMEQIKHAFLA